MMNLDIFLTPVKKMVEFNKIQFEKAINAQQVAVKEYVALTEARIKAAAAIKDAEGFAAFVKEQVELAQNGFEKAITDSKEFVEGVKTYNEEVIKLVQEGNAVITKEVKATVKKAA